MVSLLGISRDKGRAACEALSRRPWRFFCHVGLACWPLPQNRSQRWVEERKPKRRSVRRAFSLVSTHSRPSVSRKSDNAPLAEITISPCSPAQINYLRGLKAQQSRRLRHYHARNGCPRAHWPLSAWCRHGIWFLAPHLQPPQWRTKAGGCRAGGHRPAREWAIRLRVRTWLQPAESAPQGKIDRMSLRHIYLRCASMRSRSA